MIKNFLFIHNESRKEVVNRNAMKEAHQASCCPDYAGLKLWLLACFFSHFLISSLSIPFFLSLALYLTSIRDFSCILIHDFLLTFTRVFPRHVSPDSLKLYLLIKRSSVRIDEMNRMDRFESGASLFFNSVQNSREIPTCYFYIDFN